MLDITEHIEYLLMRHDCVVASGLGAFLVHEMPAAYDAKTQRFNPPSRALGFNPEVRHNDGLLAASISRREGISVDSAKAEIEVQVGALRRQLELNGEVQIGRLGVLHMGVTSEAPVFEPSESSIMRYAGLCPIFVKPLADNSCAPETDALLEAPRMLVIPTLLKIVASIVVLMVTLGIVYSTTRFVRGPELNFATLDTGLSARFETSMPSEPIVDTSIEPALSREIQLNISVPTSMMRDSVESMSQGADRYRFDDSDRYMLVVASYPSRPLAMKHIGGNPDMRVMEMDGNYRVYVATCSNIVDARTEAKAVSATYPNVWVCKR